MALVDLKTNLADWSGLKKPSDANPAAVNFFDAGSVNSTAGAKGFTKNANDVNQSDFLGISSNGQQYTYPSTVRGNRLMKPSATVAPFPGPQNFIVDSMAGAKGFTLGMNSTQFLGIANPNQPSQTFIYPNSVQNRRLMQPAGAVLFPGPQNFIDDIHSGHIGFQLNADNTNQSNFIGISGQTYTYPNSVRGGRLMTPPASTTFPGPQNFIGDIPTGATGFTLGMNSTQFLGVSSNGQTYTYPNSVLGGRLMQPPLSVAFNGPQNFINNSNSGATGFTLGMNSTQFLGISGQTYTYPNSVLGGRLMQPLNSATFPGPQNFFSNNISGATGFHLNFTNPNQSKFLGIAGQTYTYPNSVWNGRLMTPSAGVTAFPGPQNFFRPDIEQGAKGFRLNAGDFPNQSDFLGISGQTYIYPQTVRNGRLMRPLNSIAFPGPQDFLDNKFAKGFTIKMANQPGLEKSKFVGIQNNTYTAPGPYFTLGGPGNVFLLPLTSATSPTGWAQGISYLDNQLGIGSRFYYKTKNGITSKVFSEKGYFKGRRYSDLIKGGKDANGDNSKSLLYIKSTEQNSPSALEEQYSLYNLQDDSYNPYYIAQPFILRGIQRKNEKKPQYWGLSPLLDDGLVRGGIAAATEISTVDLVRLGKWAATPKGLLWTAKQVGLGLSSPQLETIVPGVISQNRIQTGVTSLLSVPTTAFGLHFTRHGIPFVNYLSDYEKVLNGKKALWDVNPTVSNRLINLKSQLISTPILSNQLAGVSDSLSSVSQLVTGIGITIPSPLAVPKIPTGLPIPALSYLGGPNSAYGIGITTINRRVDSVTNALTNAATQNFILKYDSANKYKDSITQELTDDKNQTELKFYKNQLTKLTARYFNIDNRNQAPAVNPDRDSNTIQDAVESAKKLKPDGQLGFEPKYNIKNIYSDELRAEFNLESYYGFGISRVNREIGAEPKNAKKFLISGKDFKGDLPHQLSNKEDYRGDKINAIDFINKYETTPYDSYKDFIKFYFEDAERGQNAMVFRCTINGFSDTFSPGWEQINILGRPEGAYLYNSFERTISFNFTVAAQSRSEMIPIWRKLNYLATYTMPSYDSSQTVKPSGPFMRITIGDLFYQTPGFINSLSYTVPDDATWDLGENDPDYDNINDAKQLPTMIDVSIGFTMVTDYRPQLKGRAYSLSPGGKSPAGTKGQWLADSIFAT